MKIVKYLLLSLSFIYFHHSLFADIRYIEIESIKNAPIIEVKKIEDIESIINEYGIRIGYVQSSSTESTLFVVNGAVYFSFSMNGYDSLNDFRKGNGFLFKNGRDFYAAKKLGFESGEIYYYYAENSFRSAEDCLDAFQNGFKPVDYEDDIKRVYANGQRRRTASEGYYQAKEKGLKTFDEYKEYLYYSHSGFKSKSDYQTASAKGFKKGADFYAAIEKGFSNYEEYNNAIKFGLETYSDYQIFSKIKTSCDKIASEKNINKNNAIIYYYIQCIPKGEFSLSVLSKNLSEIFNSQSKELCKALNLWASDFTSLQEYENQKKSFSRNYSDINKQLLEIKTYFHTSILVKFFENVEISVIGSYNESSEIFKKK